MELGRIFSLEFLLCEHFKAFFYIWGDRIVDEKVVPGLYLCDEFFFIFNNLLNLYFLFLIDNGVCFFIAKFIDEQGKFLRVAFFFHPLPSALWGKHLVALLEQERILNFELRVNLTLLQLDWIFFGIFTFRINFSIVLSVLPVFALFILILSLFSLYSFFFDFFFGFDLGGLCGFLDFSFG